MEPKTPEERKRSLGIAIRDAVISGGFVQSQTDYDAVIVYGKPCNHVLHLILSLVTCGAWLVVWAIVSVVGGERRMVFTVDDWGNVSTRFLGKR